MVQGQTYRYAHRGATYDIHILKIRFRGPDYIKALIIYVDKANRKLMGTDKVKIYKDDFIYWNVIED